MPKRKYDSQTPETSPEAVATVSMEEFETLKKMLEESQSKEQEYRDGWQRSVADFANYRKRTERDNEQLGKMVTGNTIKKFLGVMDDLERALANRPADDAWANGVELVYRKFQGILESENITRIPAEGQPFDPTFHEAVMQEPSESYESGTVTAVLQQGYMHGERVLRPALVKVAQ
jgi:molecular chaperone GrpE